MDITYFGHSSFRLKGKQCVVVTDPFDPQTTGLKFPKHVAANIVTVSHDHPDHNATALVEENPFLVKGPGEYEILGVGIVGIGTFHDDEKGEKRGRNTVYRFEIDGVTIVHLGDLGHALNSHDIEQLGTVDVLLVPVGGCYTIDAKTAKALIDEIEPSIVIPMHYKTAEHAEKQFADVAPLEDFLKQYGITDIVKQPKVSVVKDKLPETTQVVVLSS